jgi:putative GTP pyrophosphokinase
VPRNAKSPEEWGVEYSAIRGAHLDCTEAFERLLSQLLDSSRIEVAQLEARTKTVQSFTEKIERKKEKYVNPLQEVTDLVGLRVILYFRDAVETVGDLIEREFEVDVDNSPRRGSDQPVDRFGYRSDHYVVSLSEERRRLSEYERLADKSVEIQVRTVMDHAWSAVDHRIRYKGADLPQDLQRRLFRLKGLLEVADDQFAALRDASKDFARSYEQLVTRGELDVGIDALSLRAYLDASVGMRWSNIAHDQGFAEVEDNVPPDLTTAWTEELLALLKGIGMTQLRQLAALLDSAEVWGPQALRVVAERVDPVLRPQMPNPPELTVMMIAQIAMKDPAAVDSAKWLPEIAAGLKAAFPLSDYVPHTNT